MSSDPIRENSLQHTTFTISSIENQHPNTEERLRILLRNEKEKNEQLNSDYRILQRKNLDLMASIKNLENKNKHLNELLNKRK